MDAPRFDHLVQSLASGFSRRSALKAALSLGALAILRPNLALAAACEIDADCGELAKCDNGFCFEIDYLPAGSECDGSIPCEDPFLCQGGVCAAPAVCQTVPGEPCDPVSGCCGGLICDDQGICQPESTDPPDGGDSGGDNPTDNGGGGSGSGDGGSGSNSGGGEESYNQPTASGGSGANATAPAAAPVKLPTTGISPIAQQGSIQIGMVATAAALAAVALKNLDRIRSVTKRKG